ncbi:MAG TPA: hypothetical protein VGX46_06830, partial [Vicinamibacterales bacterium]|nr:hypothetical protein [Vicinamibacterales bacterium]
AQPIDAALHALVRLDVEFGPRVPPGSAGANAILSPDGRRLAFATFGSDGKTHLFARWLDRSNASELAGTEGAYAPFFSPDGQWIGFFANGKLKKIPADGGAATPLCDAPLGRGASWGEDGGIVLTPDLQSRLLRISSSGGNAPVPVTAFGPGEISHRWPQILPGGKAVIFTSLTAANFAAFDEATIQVVSLQNGQRKTLLQGGSYGRYLASGHMLYVRNGTAFAVPFDVDRLETRGTPVPVLEGVANVPNSGAAQLDVSAGGTLVYESGTDQRQTIQWLDATGKLEPLLAKPAFYLWIRFSPDGSRLVYRVVEGASNHLWIYDWQRGTETRLTTDSTIHNSPTWSADGRYIAYQGEGGVFFIAADGAGKPLPLFKAPNSPYPESFSADGRWLAFSAPNPVSGDMDIWTAPLADAGHELRAGTPEPFVHTLALERDAAFSPDGRWLAYTSTESGTYQAYVRAFPGTPFGSGSRWQISNTGGLQPLWSQNGHELFYRSTDNRIMVVTYATRGDAFVAEKPRVWAERQVWAAGAGGVLDIAPDGKRFAVLIPAAATGPDAQESRHHVTLVLNFFDELRRLLPVKK